MDLCDLIMDLDVGTISLPLSSLEIWELELLCVLVVMVPILRHFDPTPSARSMTERIADELAGVKVVAQMVNLLASCRFPTSNC